MCATATYYNGSTTASSTSGYIYYNNGNVVNPSFTLTQAALSGWTARGWSTSAAGNGAISYNNATAFTRDSNVTLYGMYQQTITVTYYNCSTKASTTTGTRYYNPGSGGVVNPSFTLTQAALSGWTVRGWSTGNTAAGAILYSSGATFTRDSNVTLYGMYYQAIYLYYSGNGSTSGSTATQTGYRYYNSNGNVLNYTFVLSANGFARTGYNFSTWALGSTGGTQYAAGTSITLSASNTMYAMWQKIKTPYAIVTNIICQQNITWTGTSVSGTKTTYAGNAAKFNIGGSSFTAKSQSFNTNGCDTLSINYESYPGSGSLQVFNANGVSIGYYEGVNIVQNINITNTTSFTIQVSAGGFSGQKPEAIFNNISLS